MNYYLQNISSGKGYRLIRKASQRKGRNYMKKGRGQRITESLGRRTGNELPFPLRVVKIPTIDRAVRKVANEHVSTLPQVPFRPSGDHHLIVKITEETTRSLLPSQLDAAAASPSNRFNQSIPAVREGVHLGVVHPEAPENGLHNW